MEKDTQLHILHYLRAIGAVAGKTKTMGTPLRGGFRFDQYNFRGFPDITGFYKNKLFFIEVKDKKNKQTVEQKNFQELCVAANVLYVLAYSVEDVVKALTLQA